MGWSARLAAVPVVVLIGLGAVVAVVGAAVIRDAAVVEQRAVRSGVQIQVIDPPSPSITCRRVAVVGDSLTVAAEPWLSSLLDVAGREVRIDAYVSRRIPGFVSAPYSGVRAARTVRATFGDADCWVIALGSNDLDQGGGESIGVAAALIDEMLAAVTPTAHVWWVNVDYHHDPRSPFDLVAGTHRFNTALDARAAEHPRLQVIDWYALAEANRGWFVDRVHVDRDGSAARAGQVAMALPPPP